jgi:hypothetical protein
VLYELLCGRPPFSASTPALVARAHLHDRPVPVRQLAPWVPRRLAEAAEAALAKDPAQRPSSAAAFAARIRAAANLPARAQEPGREPGPEPTRALPAGEAAPAPASTVEVGAARPVWRQHRRRFLVLPAVLLVALLALAGVRELGGRRQAAGDGPPGTAAAAAGTVTVTLRATAPVWTRATVDGRVAYEGTLVAGDRRTFTARRAVDLHLGNAGGVQLTVDGRFQGAPGRSGQVWRGRFVPDGGRER